MRNYSHTILPISIRIDNLKIQSFTCRLLEYICCIGFACANLRVRVVCVVYFFELAIGECVERLRRIWIICVTLLVLWAILILFWETARRDEVRAGVWPNRTSNHQQLRRLIRFDYYCVSKCECVWFAFSRHIDYRFFTF